MTTRVATPRPTSTSLATRTFVPVIVAAGAAVVYFASRAEHLAVASVLVVAIGISFAAERLAPYEPDWNRTHGDLGRDALHALVNETLNVLSVAALPLIAASVSLADVWPTGSPFAFQVLFAVLVFDAGVTLAHWASHRVAVLWAFHAVHHSVTRYYGLNGLMKHPVHQAIEMTAGVIPLILIGLPQPVAVALAGLTVLQLLLQHSNVDYRVGPIDRWCALNRGHRLHHLSAPGQGDVNFGLFTLVWDRALRTHAPHAEAPHITSADIGVTGRPEYPAAYLAQLAQPVRDLRSPR